MGNIMNIFHADDDDDDSSNNNNINNDDNNDNDNSSNDDNNKVVKCDDTDSIDGDSSLKSKISYLFKKYPYRMSLLVIFHIIISVCALILSWDCSKYSNTFLRILFTILATILSEIYIIYYAFYHIVMGFKCYTNGTTTISPTGINSIKPVKLPPL
jgi:hypothetical protein